MDIFLAVLALIFAIIGILGSVLPILPGPPLGYVGFLIIQFQDPSPYSTRFLVIWAFVVIGITALDYIVPTLGTKKYGGTRFGIWGCTIGLILGLFLFPPFGFLVGPMIGAFVGEMIYQRDTQKASRAAVGSFFGFLAGTALKLICSFVICYEIIATGFFG